MAGETAGLTAILNGPAVPASPQVGGSLGKYHLERLLGSGAMGEVFLAVDILLNRKVALKTINATYAGDPHFKARFLREARTLAKVNHPNVVQIYDVHDGSEGSGQGAIPFLVTEFVDGADLQSIIEKEGQLAWRRACVIARQAVQGLAAAAASDIVHRDVKPGNILVGAELAKVTDFGLAKPLIGDQSLTQAEVVMGTPDYMAPEQAMGRPIDWRADAYALGCTLYHTLTGKTPYGQGNPSYICTCHVYEPFPDVRLLAQDLPAELVALVNQLVLKDPNKRPATYDEVVQRIDIILGPTRERPPGRTYVVIDAGKQAGLRVILGDKPVIIGRIPECEVVLDDARVSRRHAAVQRTPGGFEVRDLGSRNGILVNGKQVAVAALQHDDRFTVGDTLLRFENPSKPATSATREFPAAVPLPSGRANAVEDATVAWSRLLSADDARAVEARYGAAATGTFKPTQTYAAGLHAEVLVSAVAGVPLEPLFLSQVLNQVQLIGARAIFHHHGCLHATPATALSALFGAPIAVPDPALNAVLAGFDVVRGVLELQASLAGRVSVAMRVGVGAGPTVVGFFGIPTRRDFGALGEAVDVGHRLGMLAPANQVLVTEDLYQLLGSRFPMVPCDDIVFVYGDRPKAVFIALPTPGRADSHSGWSEITSR